MNKYTSLDSIMSSEECLHFYFGSKFQDFYNPMNDHPLMDSLNQSLFFDVGESVDYGAIVNLCLEILADEVINMNVQKILIYASQLSESQDYNLYVKQFNEIINGIGESMDFTDDQLSFIVVETSDINHFVARNEWDFMGETILSERSEQLKLTVQNEVKMYNFNIGAELDYLNSEQLSTPE